jgi:hypothetical protein
LAERIQVSQTAITKVPIDGLARQLGQQGDVHQSVGEAVHNQVGHILTDGAVTGNTRLP